ncbi:hypothetical protein V3595_21500 [Bacillus sp. CFBP9009]
MHSFKTDRAAQQTINDSRHLPVIVIMFSVITLSLILSIFLGIPSQQVAIMAISSYSPAILAAILPKQKKGSLFLPYLIGITTNLLIASIIIQSGSLLSLGLMFIGILFTSIYYDYRHLVPSIVIHSVVLIYLTLWSDTLTGRLSADGDSFIVILLLFLLASTLSILLSLIGIASINVALLELEKSRKAEIKQSAMLDEITRSVNGLTNFYNELQENVHTKGKYPRKSPVPSLK